MFGFSRSAYYTRFLQRRRPDVFGLSPDDLGLLSRVLAIIRRPTVPSGTARISQPSRLAPPLVLFGRDYLTHQTVGYDHLPKSVYSGRRFARKSAALIEIQPVRRNVVVLDVLNAGRAGAVQFRRFRVNPGCRDYRNHRFPCAWCKSTLRPD